MSIIAEDLCYQLLHKFIVHRPLLWAENDIQLVIVIIINCGLQVW